MKFFFPDSQDMVDPSFDFETETRAEFRSRQRDDVYAHEVFGRVPFDGILVSKAIVDGTGEGSGRYSIAQRHRLLREGVRSFFRLEGKTLETMGDCGAFTYVKEKHPPFSVDEVLEFYVNCDFDYGVSIDHVVLAYQPSADNSLPGIDLVADEWRGRQEITLELASEFKKQHKAGKCRFVPVGVAQGWSPRSYAHAVKSLQKIGFRKIAIGGLVPLRTPDILAILEGVSAVKRDGTEFHLFGVTRCEHASAFSTFGVTSFDSTSPLRQAFKDDKDNYYTLDRTYSAIRVPQVEGNASMRRDVQAGKINQEEAIRLERTCLKRLVDFDKDRASLTSTLQALRAYETMHHGKQDRTEVYREILTDRPWKKCKCEICRDLGIHVVIFRGAERNRRRGFHNVFVFHQRLHREIAAAARRRK